MIVLPVLIICGVLFAVLMVYVAFKLFILAIKATFYAFKWGFILSPFWIAAAVYLIGGGHL